MRQAQLRPRLSRARHFPHQPRWTWDDCDCRRASLPEKEGNLARLPLLPGCITREPIRYPTACTFRHACRPIRSTAATLGCCLAAVAIIAVASGFTTRYVIATTADTTAPHLLCLDWTVLAVTRPASRFAVAAC